jgi:uncharacterized protein
MSDTTPRPDEPLEDGTQTTGPSAGDGTPAPDDTTPAPDDTTPAADDTTPAADDAADATTAESTPEAPEPVPPPPAPPAPAAEQSAAPPPPASPQAYPPPSPQAYPAPQPYGGPEAQPQLTTAQSAMTPQEERTWSMATHGIVLAALVLSGGTLGFVAALVMYLVYRDRGPYIRANTANALNIQIMTIIGVVISFVLMFVLIGFVTIFLVGIYALVLHIIGIVKANNGEWWDPPLTPKFVR